MTMETTNILLKRVPKNIILILQEEKEPVSISYLSKKANATYCHTHICLIEFKSNEWITIKKQGRSQMCELTKEGKKIAEAVELIIISGERLKL